MQNCKKNDNSKDKKKPDIMNSLYQVENFLCKVNKTCKVFSIKNFINKINHF